MVNMKEGLQAPAQIKYKSKLLLLLLLLGVIILLPILVLMAYNYPGADDFGFAYRDRTVGFWESQKHYYLNWSGRYFATGIIRISPLVWGSVAIYKILAACLILLFGGALVWLIRILFSKKQSTKQSLALSALIFCLFISQVPDITQSMFWLCGSLAYQLPNILFLLLLITIAIMLKGNITGINSVSVIASCILILMIIGSNEMALLMTLSVLFLLVLVCWRHRKEHAAHMVVLFGVALTGALVVVLAPGNYVRMSSHPRHSELMWSIVYTTYLTMLFFVQWGGMLLLASVLYVLLWGYEVGAKSSGALLLKVDVRWSILLYLATLFAMQFLFTWATSDKATARVENVIYFYFLLGWFFNLQLLVGQYPHIFNKHIFSPHISVVAFVVLVILHFKINGNVTTAYLDLLSGKAATYREEMEARFRYLSSSGCEDCSVPPLTAIPQTILFKDLAPHSSHQDYWVNVGYAAYWRKEEVNLIRQNPKAEENIVTLRKLLQQQ